MLFLFGLFSTCLDPITYGLFTIHFTSLKRYCCSTNMMAESEANSTTTGSFGCSASSLRMKRLTELAHEMQGSSGARNKPERKTGYYSNGNSYLAVYKEGTNDL
ncbi:UNVERIFIED_CONTAM: hypothetical protein FKN15_015998 [Acipenser sinensis]